MKQMVCALVIGLGLSGTFAEASVAVTNIVLTEQEDAHPSSFTVPAGKVLVVEHVFNGAVGNSIGYWIQVSNFSLRVSISAANGMVSYTPSLKFSEGTTLNAQDGDDSGIGVIYALLVDPEDVYAAITSEFTSLYASAVDLHGTLQLGSPRPSTVRIERREHLGSGEWQPDMETTISNTDSKIARSFSVPIPEGDSQFYRARARARR